MKIIHSADWHLGHRLYGQSRSYEHACFLAWLLDLLVEREIDVLLVAGDIFDTANPPAHALSQWYSFLAECQRQCPGLTVIAIGGNHDSVARLDAPRALLSALRVEVVGGAYRHGQALDPEAMCLPLRPRNSEEIAAWVAAVPFLRPSDLELAGREKKGDGASEDAVHRGGENGPEAEAEANTDAEAQLTGGEDPLIKGVFNFYERVFAALARQRKPGQRALAMGHLYLRNGVISEWSERKVLGGNQHALPAEIFPAWLDYVALGHLHRAQAVGAEHIRYSGSPIPMSMDERDYPHQVLHIEWDHRCEAKEAARIEKVRVPRWVDLLRLPEKDALPVKELLQTLKRGDWIDAATARRSSNRALAPEIEGDSREAAWRQQWAAIAGIDAPPRPWLEVAVSLEAPEPGLRAMIEEALEGQALRLAKIGVEYQGDGRTLGDRAHSEGLAALGPDEVFAHRHRQLYGQDPEADLREAFAHLLEEVQHSPVSEEAR